MTVYADSMGFLFSQKELIEKPTGMSIDPNIRLDLCHMTATPPFMHTIAEITRECAWFAETVETSGGIVLDRYRNLHKDGLKVVMGLQHPPIDATIADLQGLRNMGVLFCTIGYELENQFGSGFANPYAPLTNHGKEFLRYLAEACMILDLSHAGHQTARDALVEIRTFGLDLPVVATHTGMFNVYRHNRNLPDDVLQEIRYLGGIVGVATCTFMNHGVDNTLQPFWQHLQHAVQLLGNKHVCLGTDGVYKHLDVAEDRERFALMKNLIDPHDNFRARYPDQPLALSGPDRMKRIEVELRESYTEHIAEQLLGRNFFNYIVPKL